MQQQLSEQWIGAEVIGYAANGTSLPGENWEIQIRLNTGTVVKVRGTVRYDRAYHPQPSNTSVTKGDGMTNILRLYQHLADNLSDMVEEGQLNCLRTEDYTFLVELLAKIADAEAVQK
jgi:hypothetical protein